MVAARSWGQLQDGLNRLVHAGCGLEVGAVVDDRVLDAFAVRCAPDRVPDARCSGLVDRTAPTFHARPESKPPAEWARIVERLSAVATRQGY